MNTTAKILDAAKPWASCKDLEGTGCVCKFQKTASKLATLAEELAGVNDVIRLIGTGVLSAVCYPLYMRKAGALDTIY